MDFIYEIYILFKCRKILRHEADGFIAPPKEGVLQYVSWDSDPGLPVRSNSSKYLTATFGNYSFVVSRRKQCHPVINCPKTMEHLQLFIRGHSLYSFIKFSRTHY
jgi:hypothetical protein